MKEGGMIFDTAQAGPAHGVRKARCNCRGSGWVDGGQLKVGVNLLMHQHATGLLCIYTNPQVIHFRIQI